MGGAQEDSDCLLAPEWQKIFEDKVAEMLKKLVMLAILLLSACSVVAGVLRIHQYVT